MLVRFNLSRCDLIRSSALVALFVTGIALPVQGQRLLIPNPQPVLPVQAISDEVIYKHFFKHVAAFSQYADERQQQGLSPEPFRHYFRRKLKLSPAEELDLNTIALDYVQALVPVKKQAAAILAAFHAQYPPGMTTKAKIPISAPDFSVIKLQKRAILQQHIDRWHTTLDESEYVRLHTLIQTQVTKNLQNAKGSTQ